ncbi:4-hydroxy-3-methylbut-2-en-1-yl diphosphate synthase [Roseivirga sp. 4D4]|uniref:(E)-4-hydroxy-3-methylbut-2-enyl-diphosphate synthase n=1 Tax=Roseivirga sp. 4D4 TaxID=1889784 RepID=UPI000852BAE6|nr:(E)-4-hydroxy-3-methylbut-2-enyl-diphosphate synthase [Roseivirga sp. 4D4]OEK01709.1 4-hydroxy-3-methylbut-2-en-1-yl diphosphate synthase [Roseivirga sp. 4D4]
MNSSVASVKNYCKSLVKYHRRKSIPVKVGDVIIGGDNPIVVQSMTTIDTMDTMGSVEQTIRMVEAGCELVRITAPSLKEAENLRHIKAELRKRGYNVPLVADIHFTPNAAELAAQIVEKVRVNPGNYADKKKFENIEYTDETYEAELQRIRDRFTPLVELCKAHGTAMRIGTNHGSLSDRIMSRYGDTALGMVESALEFLRICEDLDFDQIVISMKSSNAQVMVEAYRLLVQKLDEEGLKPYPLHLGVTEAGEAEDGRIKSAVGIGTLLEDGLGDTVRVSLTEEPEFEAPVAQKLVDQYINREDHDAIAEIEESPIDPYAYHRRQTREIVNIGQTNVPRVMADFSRIDEVSIKSLKAIGHFYLPEPDKWTMNDQGADYVYSGGKAIPFMLPNGIREVIDYPIWNELEDKKNRHPIYALDQLKVAENCDDTLNFVTLEDHQLDDDTMSILEADNLVVVLKTRNKHAMPALRRFFFELEKRKLKVPVIIERGYEIVYEETFLIQASTDVGGLLVDGFGDGVMLSATEKDDVDALKLKNQTAFGILQAGRTRMTKTEYISCPSCGRTLFDLQETTAMIRKRTDHLKGVKIGIMGCIVNGPGEMADADFGYVGSGKGKITLYKGQDVVKRGVPSEQAVDELIEIIRQDGKWMEPQTIEG